MAVRQYALHFNLPEGCIVCLSIVVSFLLVFAFGIYIGKEVQAYKTAQETRTVRFPVEPADHNVTVCPAPQTFPLTSKRTSAKPTQNSQPQTTSSALSVGESGATNSVPASQNKERETVNRLTKNGETLYRLRVGTFTQEEAQRVAARFRREEKFAQAYLVSD